MLATRGPLPAPVPVDAVVGGRVSANESLPARVLLPASAASSVLPVALALADDDDDDEGGEGWGAAGVAKPLLLVLPWATGVAGDLPVEVAAGPRRGDEEAAAAEEAAAWRVEEGDASKEREGEDRPRRRVGAVTAAALPTPVSVPMPVPVERAEADEEETEETCCRRAEEDACRASRGGTPLAALVPPA